MIQLKLIGVRGIFCKSVALIFSNHQELFVTHEAAKRLLGKKRFMYFAKKENLAFKYFEDILFSDNEK